MSDTAPDGSTPQSYKETADEALEVFRQLGDDLGLARAWMLQGRVSWNHCRFDDAAQAHERAVAFARRAGDETAEMQAMTALVGAINYGGTSAPEAQRRIEALLARESTLPAFDARAALALARQRSLQGAFGEARTLYFQAKELLEELGRTYGVATAAAYCDEVALLAGDAEFAERELRAAYDVLGAMGAFRIRAMIATLLGEALYVLGRCAEAEEFADVALETSGHDDVASQARSRALKAKVLAARGEHHAAAELASEGVDLLADTDDLFGYAQTLMALAEVRRDAGRGTEAVLVLQTALEVSERKGDVVTAERARARLAELELAAAS